MQENTNLHKHSDGKHNLHKAGFVLSVICAIHCLAFPFLIAFLPSFAAYLHLNHWLELLLFVLILVLSHLFSTGNLSIVFSILGGLLLVYGHYKNWKLHKQRCHH